MPQLPAEFLNRMKELLGEEYGDFLASYERPRASGLRVNTRKCRPAKFPGLVPFDLRPVPWTDNGFFCDGSQRPAQHPLYAAGVYYLQEPSAMTPASRLGVRPGDRVLDLCAAPGGKATELAAALGGEGLLVANDISASRARALLRNLELFGAADLFVTSETPARLARAFPGYFDRILVDAPCSGEGMFRKDPSVAAAWTPERPAYFARLQREITVQAAGMLRPGGLLLYSTCTFAPEENEGTVAHLLAACPSLSLREIAPFEGFAPGRPEWADHNPELSKCVRIWPHRMEGEGHFLALFQKADAPAGDAAPPRTDASSRKKGSRNVPEAAPSREEARILSEFFSHMREQPDPRRLEVRGGRVYLAPHLPDTVRGLSFLRSGLYLGELKKNRFEPSQPLAMTLGQTAYDDCLNLAADDPRVSRYLLGETLNLSDEETRAAGGGWTLVCVEGFALGWGRRTGSILKNKYPASWRRQQR